MGGVPPNAGEDVRRSTSYRPLELERDRAPYHRTMPTFRIAGHDIDLTADDVRSRLSGVLPEPVQVWSVEIGAHRYPVVQALEVASGVARSETRSSRAREVLTKLGFEPRFDPSALRTDEKLVNGALLTLTSEEISGDADDVTEPSWASMDSRPRASILRLGNVPRSYGVYAFYRADARVYVGRAASAGGLEKRLNMHLNRSADLSWSAFRRNVAEQFGIPTSQTRPHKDCLSSAQLGRVNAWVDGCEVAWIETDSVEGAKKLEKRLKSEFMPPLTKR